MIKIIDEHIVVAIAYRFHEKNIENNKNIIIFDLGGCACNITILNIKKGVNNLENTFDILSAKRDNYLGGENFYNILVEYFLDEFCKFKNLSKEEVKKDKKAIWKLKISCEKIKKSFL